MSAYDRLAMRILVIGGSQLSGPFMVRQLIERGHDVTLYNRGNHPTPMGASHILAPRELGPAEDRYHLVANLEAFRRARPDVVVHMIAFTRADAEAFVRVFAGLARRAVVVSSSDVYLPMGILNRTETGPPVPVPMNEDAPQRRKPSIHGPEREKQHVEQVVSDASTLPATILRFPAVYGPGTHRHGDWVRRMLDDRPAIIVGKGYVEFRFSHGYAEDVAMSIMLAATDDLAAGRVYNVGERDVPTERERLERWARVARWNGRIIEVPDEQIPGGDGLPFPGQDWWLDTSRIRAELGYREVADEDEAIRATIGWQRDHPNGPGMPSPWDYAKEDALLATLER
jgi:nucleoside-diphosphate-sugar epimerase